MPRRKNHRRKPKRPQERNSAQSARVQALRQRKRRRSAPSRARARLAFRRDIITAPRLGVAIGSVALLVALGQLWLGPFHGGQPAEKLTFLSYGLGKGFDYQTNRVWDLNGFALIRNDSRHDVVVSSVNLIVGYERSGGRDNVSVRLLSADDPTYHSMTVTPGEAIMFRGSIAPDDPGLAKLRGRHASYVITAYVSDNKKWSAGPAHVKSGLLSPLAVCDRSNGVPANCRLVARSATQEGSSPAERVCLGPTWCIEITPPQYTPQP